MMDSEVFNLIPPDLIKFILVVLFSLLIGLEQRRHYSNVEYESLFGTDRTFTLIGILGYILYIISPQNLFAFLAGGFAVVLLLALYYFQKIKMQQRYGLTSVIAALITYSLSPLIYTQPQWLVLLIVICLLVIIEIKDTLLAFSNKFDKNEFISLAKFLVLAGVILPLLPTRAISVTINTSLYQIWLAIVVVSAISYTSYLLRKFFFPDSGILLTGLLGGLYSSTATTVILARKSRENVSGNRIIASIFLAITMMYVRILALAFIFKEDTAISLLPYFSILIVISLGVALYFGKLKKAEVDNESEKIAHDVHQNPLEFKTALLFGVLFIFFTLVTSYVVKAYGEKGVNVLSFLVGVTDIDPFILNLFQGKWNINNSIITIAVINAITSNNILKLIYALVLGDKHLRKKLAAAFSVLILAGLLLVCL